MDAVTVAAARTAFDRAYQAAADRWPVPVTSRMVPTEAGQTHVLDCGAPGAPAVLLLPGGGATALAWAGVAGVLAERFRVLAVDPVGQAGLSTRSERPFRTAADLGGWLGQLLAGLTVSRLAVAGHSYGAWLALRYALDAPGQVSRLVLIDPTGCLAPMRAAYRLRAAGLLVRPSAARARRLVAWETGGRAMDPAWLAVYAAGADLARPEIILPRRPRPGELAGLVPPVLVLAGARSRAHDPDTTTALARQRLPGARTAVLAGASHHSLPVLDAAEVASYVEGFAAGA